MCNVFSLKKTKTIYSLEMDSLSEQTLSGLTEKEIKQLAKRCPIVLCVTEDVQLDRFEYTDVLESNNDEFLKDLKVDLEDARVSVYHL